MGPKRMNELNKLNPFILQHTQSFEVDGEKHRRQNIIEFYVAKKPYTLKFILDNM